MPVYPQTSFNLRFKHKCECLTVIEVYEENVYSGIDFQCPKCKQTYKLTFAVEQIGEPAQMVTCPKCRGFVTTDCPNCVGEGENDGEFCGECDGRGYIDCSLCEGKGVVEPWEV